MPPTHVDGRGGDGQARDAAEVCRLRPAPTGRVLLPPALFALDAEGLRLGVAREMPATAANPGCCAQMWRVGGGGGLGLPLLLRPEAASPAPPVTQPAVARPFLARGLGSRKGCVRGCRGSSDMEAGKEARPTVTRCQSRVWPLLSPSCSLYVCDPQAASGRGTPGQQRRAGIPEPKASPRPCHHAPVTGSWLVNVTSFSFGGSLLPHKGDNGPEA